MGASYLCFAVLSSFQNSSSSRGATPGHAMRFLRNSHKQSPVAPPSQTFLFHPFWGLHGIDETLAVFLVRSGHLWSCGPEPWCGSSPFTVSSCHQLFL